MDISDGYKWIGFSIYYTNLGWLWELFVKQKYIICLTLSRVVWCVVFPVVNTLVYGDGIAEHDRRREIMEYSE